MRPPKFTNSDYRQEGRVVPLFHAPSGYVTPAYTLWAALQQAPDQIGGTPGACYFELQLIANLIFVSGRSLAPGFIILTLKLRNQQSYRMHDHLTG